MNSSMHCRIFFPKVFYIDLENLTGGSEGDAGIFSSGVEVQCQRFTPSHLAGGTAAISLFMPEKNVPCSPRNNGTFSS